METLVKKEFWIQPKPKFLDIKLNESGITLSSLLTIYVSKYKIKDNALLLSSKFNKHFNTFLNAIPIRDSTIDEKWGEHYFFTVITSETQYDSQIKPVINEKLEKHIAKFDEILDNCCYDIHPNKLKSSLSLNETYYIDMSEGAIWIISTTTRGFHHGIQTVIQIIEHALFQLEINEGYITLPRLTVVDFPGHKYRGISIDVTKLKLTTDYLTEIVPFFTKFKINHIIFVYSGEFPESNENKRKLVDVCKFHQLIPKFLLKSDIELDDNLAMVNVICDYRINIPNYSQTIEAIAANSNKEGILISIPEDWNYSFDLFLLGFPLFAEILWNNYPLSLEKWILHTQTTRLNLFECRLSEKEQDFSKIFEVPSNTQEISSVLSLLEILRNNAYENENLLTALVKALSAYITA